MALTLTVLGSSGTYAGAGNACSGYLIRSGGLSVLVDAGPGTLANLQRHIPVTDIDAIVVSHVHPDHWLELPVLRNALHYVHRTTGVPLHTTDEVLDAADGLTLGGISATFVPTVIKDGSDFRIGPLRFRTSRTDHPPETLAVRVDDGDSSLAYTADTGPEWSVSELGPDLDVVLSEATFLDERREDEGDDGRPAPRPVHLSALQAGRLARDAGARRLLVTHVLPTGSVDDAVAEASDAFGARAEPAEVNRTYEV
jgi:ribonuclease BN (tRNA processing enzyme)